MASRLVVDALAMAVRRRGRVAGVIARPDRGSPYASEHLQSELKRYETVGSMGGVGQCWDDAVIESTFGRLKVELCHHESYATRDQAKASSFEHVEVFYNRVRRHSTPGYKTPGEFERTHNRNSRQHAVHFPWGRSGRRCR